MRIMADLVSNEIIQIEPLTTPGSTTPLNGRYAIPVPSGEVQIDSSSYVLPQDSGSVVSKAYTNLLNAFPTYSNIEFNPLITGSNSGLIDRAATVDNTGLNIINDPLFQNVWQTRMQTGRAAGPDPIGNCPNSTALLPVNDSDPLLLKPGLLVTDTIDISAALSGGSTDKFLVFWKFYRISITEDVNSSFGATSGINTPTIKTLEEIDPNTSDIVVAMSNNDGNLYTPINFLRPFSLCVPGNKIRLAFINTGSEKLYLASYAVLF